MKSWRATKSEAAAIAGAGAILMLIVVMLMTGPFCLHYTVNFWLAYVGKPAAFGWGWSMLGLPLGWLAVPAAILTKISTFFL